MPKINEFDVLVDTFVDQLVAEIEGFAEADRPFGERKLSREDQMVRYEKMRDDPQAWTDLIEQRGHEAAWKYALAMEKRRGKG